MSTLLPAPERCGVCGGDGMALAMPDAARLLQLFLGACVLAQHLDDSDSVSAAECARVGRMP